MNVMPSQIKFNGSCSDCGSVANARAAPELPSCGDSQIA